MPASAIRPRPLPRRPRATITRCRAPSRRRPRPPRSHRNRRLSRRRPRTGAAAPAATARVDAAPAVPVVSDKPQPVTKPSAPPPKVNVVTVDAQDSTRLAAAGRQTRAAGRTGTRPRRSRNVRRASATASNATRPQPLRNEIRNAGDGRARQGIGEARPVVAAAVDVIGVVDAGEHRFVPAGSSSSGANPVAAAMTEQLVRQSSEVSSRRRLRQRRKPDRDQVTANAFGIKRPRMPTKACGPRETNCCADGLTRCYAATASACGCAAATGATS